MALKRYDVVDLHTGRKTTLQLSDEDAKKMGLTAKDESKPAAKAAKAPANKAAKSPANKAADAESQKADG